MPDYSKNSDDDALWSGLQAGSEAAFELLYHRYFRELYAYGISLLSDEESVNDAIQDLFLEIWRKREVLSPARSVKFYLLGSLRRRIHRPDFPSRPTTQPPLSRRTPPGLLCSFINF